MNNATSPTSPLRRDAATKLLRARALAFVLLLNACYTWRPVELTPTRAFTEYERVRVVRSNGSKAVFDVPRIVDDSLVNLRPDAGVRTAIPIADIRRAEVRQLSGRRTALLMVGVAVTVVFAVAAFAASTLDI